LYPDSEIRERFSEIFIEFGIKIQQHVGETVGTPIKPDNARRTINNEDKLRNKALNSIKLSNSEEMATENYEEINSKVIKSKINIIILKNILERYQLLFNTFYETHMDEVER
jgi:hypothetical protein